jgi:hypothetical protein
VVSASFLSRRPDHVPCSCVQLPCSFIKCNWTPKMNSRRIRAFCSAASFVQSPAISLLRCLHNSALKNISTRNGIERRIQARALPLGSPYRPNFPNNLFHLECPLSGVKRTSLVALHMSAFDPKRTCTKIAAVRDGSVSGGLGRYPVRSLFPLHADAELYRQRRATDQILALVEFQKRHPL